MIFSSFGSGGDDLTVDGCVEARPGPTYPEAYRSDETSEHTKNSIVRCLLCDSNITRSHWEKARTARVDIYIHEMARTSNFYVWLREKLPDFDITLPHRNQFA